MVCRLGYRLKRMVLNLALHLALIVFLTTTDGIAS